MPARSEQIERSAQHTGQLTMRGILTTTRRTTGFFKFQKKSKGFSSTSVGSAAADAAVSMFSADVVTPGKFERRLEEVPAAFGLFKERGF
jgi:hypothetical protein